MIRAAEAVVADTVGVPVIAVPHQGQTHASFRELAALLGVMSPWSPNVAVVNVELMTVLARHNWRREQSAVTCGVPGEEIAMNEVMSLAEIQAQFESEWVLVEDPETTETLGVKNGKVLWHSRDRDEVYRKARELRPKHSAILYTGSLPEDMEIVL